MKENLSKMDGMLDSLDGQRFSCLSNGNTIPPEIYCGPCGWSSTDDGSMVPILEHLIPPAPSAVAKVYTQQSHVGVQDLSIADNTKTSSHLFPAIMVQESLVGPITLPWTWNDVPTFFEDLPPSVYRLVDEQGLTKSEALALHQRLWRMFDHFAGKAHRTEQDLEKLKLYFLRHKRALGYPQGLILTNNPDQYMIFQSPADYMEWTKVYGNSTYTELKHTPTIFEEQVSQEGGFGGFTVCDRERGLTWRHLAMANCDEVDVWMLDRVETHKHQSQFEIDMERRRKLCDEFDATFPHLFLQSDFNDIDNNSARRQHSPLMPIDADGGLSNVDSLNTFKLTPHEQSNITIAPLHSFAFDDWTPSVRSQDLFNLNRSEQSEGPIPSHHQTNKTYPLTRLESFNHFDNLPTYFDESNPAYRFVCKWSTCYKYLNSKKELDDHICKDHVRTLPQLFQAGQLQTEGMTKDEGLRQKNKTFLKPFHCDWRGCLQCAEKEICQSLNDCEFACGKVLLRKGEVKMSNLENVVANLAERIDEDIGPYTKGKHIFWTYSASQMEKHIKKETIARDEAWRALPKMWRKREFERLQKARAVSKETRKAVKNLDA